MNLKKKIAILGSGKLALEYSKILRKHDISIYACSSSSKKSKSWLKFRKENRSTIFMSNEEILKSDKFTHIISCLPHLLQKKYFERLLKSKKNILIEKPFSFSSLKYKKLIKRNKKKLKNKYLAFNRRFYETVNILKKRIEKNDIKYVEVKISENFKNIFHTTDLHLISLICFFIYLKNLK